MIGTETTDNTKDLSWWEVFFCTETNDKRASQGRLYTIKTKPRGIYLSAIVILYHITKNSAVLITAVKSIA